jgi:hypothetical protein
LRRDAETMRRWVKDIRRWRCPKLPEPEVTDCELCKAKGMELAFGGDAACPQCFGAGRYIPETPSDEQLEQWRHEVADNAEPTLGNPL